MHALNSLSNALLSMLTRKPCTGYELTKLLQLFWQAQHSQIYPLLGKLEQGGLVTFELICQTGKPDKKVYSITDAGTAKLQQWIREQPPMEYQERDEFLIKVYAIGVMEPETARRLFLERRDALLARLTRLEAQIKLMDEEEGIPVTDLASRQFGRYLLYQRKVRIIKEEMEWVDWSLPLFKSSVTID
ncbi:PadR family transcriptional regulator [Paenibacillus sacheonensis]|uniref:PadR family transcriptional regulator n=1 Tax=Paenibacillus sacheonensis TaxID=742054 RepID=A0A7X4YW21_9BACL|nr:PadR family transcriptional regulator [Paenibacillus sacheonensis]MBM7569005.1 DNA-binding PadR family transcriptional regulator [Paenibacillus sacheonensis]NBC72624.1 PadR family transcriptional regulator [Paenibacillus sacheonensis]